MKISKKAAAQIGAALAEELHASENVDQRAGVLNARSAIIDLICGGSGDWHPSYDSLHTAFEQRLDELEPLSVPRFKLVRTVEGGTAVVRA